MTSFCVQHPSQNNPHIHGCFIAYSNEEVWWWKQTKIKKTCRYIIEILTDWGHGWTKIVQTALWMRTAASHVKKIKPHDVKRVINKTKIGGNNNITWLHSNRLTVFCLQEKSLEEKPKNCQRDIVPHCWINWYEIKCWA